MIYRDPSLFNIEAKCKKCPLCSTNFEIKIAGNSENLSIVRKQVKEVVKYCDLSEEDLFDLQLAAGEALTNAIEHGSPLKSRNSIGVTINCDSTSIRICVSDQGNFIRKVQADEGFLDFRGRGIPLMLALMDKVVIDESETGTKVVLEKKVKIFRDE